MQGVQPSEPADLASAAGLDKAAKASNCREIRLSFWYFFVVIKWGSERRSPNRIADDRQTYPALTASTAPVLAAMWAALFLILYMVLQAAIRLLVYLVS